MMTPLRQRMLENSSGGTTLLKPFDCTSGTSPSSLNIFIARPINQYQLFLIQEKKPAWSSYNQIVCALRFFLCQDFEARVPARGHSFPTEGARRMLPMSPRVQGLYKE
jgi:hypothetical protein